ncbi:MAG: hypothetical protein ACM3NQ_08320 [Bacteroidales bacterium]
MPFLRFSRDKRGYETTALVHAFRRRGRSLPRILYWFRTPADTRVGRAPLDEEAIRLLEEHHRDVSFDWPKILEGTPTLGTVEPERGARGADARPRERRRTPRGAEPALAERLEADAGEQAAAALAGTPTPDEEAVTSPLDESQPRSRFSPEDLARLRGRHAALLARIDEEVTDAERAEHLRTQADALNPDTWVTPEDVRQALERYEQVYRELREALGRRRRRRPSHPTGGHEPPQVV